MHRADSNSEGMVFVKFSFDTKSVSSTVSCAFEINEMKREMDSTNFIEHLGMNLNRRIVNSIVI